MTSDLPPNTPRQHFKAEELQSSAHQGKDRAPYTHPDILYAASSGVNDGAERAVGATHEEIWPQAAIKQESLHKEPLAANKTVLQQQPPPPTMPRTFSMSSSSCFHFLSQVHLAAAFFASFLLAACLPVPPLPFPSREVILLSTK